jgi:hypothetical protein
VTLAPTRIVRPVAPKDDFDASTRATLKAATRAVKRRKKQLVASMRSPTPHACSLLVVDPGDNSGWAMSSLGELRSLGECDVYSQDPTHILTLFTTLLPGPHVLVVERPFRAKFGQTNMGTAEKIWRKHAEKMGFGKRVARRVVRVYPSTWRSAVLGKGWGVAERADVRAEELRVAAQIVCGSVRCQDDGDLGPDSAPAVLMNQWAMHAGEVAMVLPRPREPRARRTP